ncbi:MAG TPA: metallophosphoesterase [Acidimicrobiales bacterium]
MTSIRRRADPWLFAVEDTTVQLTWSVGGLAAGTLRVGDRHIDVPAAPGPNSLILTGLEPGQVVRGVGGSLGRRIHAHTLPSPPGRELFRFATLSDLHIGERTFGYRSTIVEDPAPEQFHPERSTRAALAELTAWGAQALVLKGDITHSGKAYQWDRFAAAINGFELPLVMIPGNHDADESYPEPKKRKGAATATTDREPPISVEEARRRLGLGPVGPVQVLDVPGLRILAVDTTVADLGEGQVSHVTDETADRAGEVDTPVFVALHHQLLRLPMNHHLPLGVPAAQARHFLSRLQAANPAAFVTSGHTHRHRRRHHGSIVITEVGSPKDYPGTWAGYVVHEGGIRQVVRRIGTPDILTWTDRTADAALGAWGRWSPGTLDARCFTHVWPSRGAGRAPDPARLD